MTRLLLCCLLLGTMGAVQGDPVPAPAEARLYFIEPQDGAVARGPVRVVFGLRGMGVAPAGVAIPNTGHHHLLVNTTLMDRQAPIPTDARHLHFGMGQTEAVLDLPPGTHTLQLVLGDHLHRPHEPPVTSEVITITVAPVDR